MFRLTFRSLAAGHLSILAFHGVPDQAHPLWPTDVTLERFKRTLEELQRTYQFLPLLEALKLLRAGRLPKAAMAVTFDDGYPGWVSSAAPILEAANIHATFFVTTSQLSGAPLWSERLRHALQQAPSATQLADMAPALAALQTALPMATQADRVATAGVLDELLKYQPLQAREALLQALEQRCGVPLPGEPGALVSGFTSEHVRWLHGRGFDIGAHSISHTVLSRCDDRQALEECAGSRHELEAIIGARVRGFAFPNGAPTRDFDARHVELLRKVGFDYAVTTARGSATDASNFMALPRFTPWGPSHGRMNYQVLRNLWQTDPRLVDVCEPQPRALMVAFHFPPQSGSSGLLRTLNFAKYLPANGWQPTVLTARPQAYEKTSLDLVGDIPGTCAVVRAPALDAARDLSVRGKYFSVTAVPDRWSTWAVGAIWRGLRYVHTHRSRAPVRAVWSTYPIPTAHVIGGVVAGLTGLPWVADFRDPMNASGETMAGLRKLVWDLIERQTIRHADVCVFTTESASRSYAQRFPAHAAKFKVIENGYDEEAFASIQAAPRADGKLLMLHSGVIYPKDRNPRAFFVAVKNLMAQGALPRDRLVIRFRASGQDNLISQIAEEVGILDVFDVAPSLPYREAVAEMMSADLLLLFQGEKFNAQIPAKAYEYLRCAKPVLGLVHAAGQAHALLANFRQTYLTDIEDPAAIERELLAWCEAAKNDAAVRAELSHNLPQIQAYSRATQSGRLAQLLRDLAG